MDVATFDAAKGVGYRWVEPLAVPRRAAPTARG
jgi:hypothetical protein